MTPILEKNLQIIAGRFPYLFEELKSVAVVTVDPSKVAAYLEKVYGPVSKRAAILERWTLALPNEQRRLLVSGGFGDGSHIQTLLDAVHPSCRVLVIEADLSQFLAILKTSDLSDLLRHPRLTLAAPFSLREMIAMLNIELIEVDTSAIFIYSPIQEYAGGLYPNLLANAMRQLTTRRNQIQTDIDNGQAVFANTLENINAFGLGIEANALDGAFQDKPLVLVAAGPSLDQSFDFLRKAQGKALIVVANSAYRAVINQGIQPDLTVAVDPNLGTLRGYEGVSTESVYLLTSFLVYPEVPKLFPGRVIPLAEYNYTATTLRKLLKLAEHTQWVGDGTVTATIINLAGHLGCKEVYLVGQDLAITDDGRSHVQDSFYTDDGTNLVNVEDCQAVKGNFKDRVSVESKLYEYLKIIEALVSHYMDIDFYNLSPIGANIHGAKPMTLLDAAKRMDEFPSFDYKSKIEAIAKDSRIPHHFTEAIYQVLHKYNGFLESLLRAMIAYAVRAESASKEEKAIAIADAAADSPLKKNHKAIMEIIERNPLFTTVAMEGKTKGEYHEGIRGGEPWRLINDTTAPFSATLSHAWSFIEGIVFQIEKLAPLVEKAKIERLIEPES
jgi:hypothetical protein